MHAPRRWPALLLSLALVRAPDAAAQEGERVTLNGPWAFALDPLGDGERNGWHRPDAAVSRGWDRVAVPHTWSTDPRYQHTGTAWYRRSFAAPASLRGRHARLAFGAVFYRARVYLNGHLLGEHEGGYTPFTLDATPHLDVGGENTLAVAVDNAWDRTTLPGARTGAAATHQVYPWWNYGGVVRDVELVATSPVYVENQKVVATPDLGRGTAAVEVTVWVANATARPVTAPVGLEIRRRGQEPALADWRRDARLRASVQVPAGGAAPVRLRLALPRAQVALWHLDRPTLYEARAAVLADSGGADAAPRHAHRVAFGIRKVEVRDARLLLNGEPVRMAGGNRPSDHPTAGLVEPDSVVFRDLRMMKEAGMELSRINHHAPPANALDWADRHGMLLVLEGPNWQLDPAQMDDSLTRRKFRSQMREMVARDWNHPSVIGWSVGNEYVADHPAAVRWTRDLSADVRALDPSRLVTFVALGGEANPSPLPREARSFHYADLLCINLYSPPDRVAAAVDRLHALWPDKPVFITEFGRREDADRAGAGPADARGEAAQARYFRDFARAVRARPFVVGASVWTFQDYRSRFPGTNPSGHRPWGVVDPARRPRPAYAAFREEFAPVTVAAERDGPAGGVRVRLAARADFPRYTLRNYAVRYQLLDAAGRTLHEERRPVPVLRPGEQLDVTFAPPADREPGAAAARVDVMRPTGFSMMHRTVDLTAEAAR
jgi:beta-glucuronidase